MSWGNSKYYSTWTDDDVVVGVSVVVVGGGGGVGVGVGGGVRVRGQWQQPCSSDACEGLGPSRPGRGDISEKGVK